MAEYGLLGEHLSHSYSPQIHCMLGDYKYELIELKREELGAFLRSGSFKGLNVTIPYKIDAAAYCDEISERACRIGCVNTIVNRNGKIFGYNTDYFGFDYMIEKSRTAIKGAKCLVLGNGGAARTVRTVLSDRKAGEIITVSRSGKDNYDNIFRHYDADIIVNTTPLGMYPNCGVSAVELEHFKKCCGVFDLIYNPARTKLLLDAERLGIPCAGGLSMLVAQAKQSSDLFFDRTGDDSPVIDGIVQKLSLEMQNIILIGMPGCGKSTVGRLTAKKLGKKFIDSDEQIVKETGKTIPEIFRDEGEAGFRKIEAQILKNICCRSGQVVASGGGCVTVAENYESMKQNGIIIWIKREISKLERKGRPLSMGADMIKMYDDRKSFYEKFSDFCVENDDSAEETSCRIINILKSEASR